MRLPLGRKPNVRFRTTFLEKRSVSWRPNSRRAGMRPNCDHSGSPALRPKADVVVEAYHRPGLGHSFPLPLPRGTAGHAETGRWLSRESPLCSLMAWHGMVIAFMKPQLGQTSNRARGSILIGNIFDVILVTGLSHTCHCLLALFPNAAKQVPVITRCLPVLGWRASWPRK